MTEFSRVLEHLRRHAVRTDGPFTLRSGEISDWYIDARQTTFDGEGARLVGTVKTGDVVTILEDTTTSGSALVEAIRVALESGLTVNRAITLVDRSGGKAAGRVEEMGIEFRAICTPQDLGI